MTTAPAMDLGNFSVSLAVRKQGIEPTTPADETTTGPASFVVVDPDGNPVLVDQHV
jgi:hypothetical protein